MSYMNQNEKRKKKLSRVRSTDWKSFIVTWLAGDVKEPTHISLRVGHGVPIVVVWPWFSVLYFMG